MMPGEQDGFEARNGLGCLGLLLTAAALAVLIVLARKYGWSR